MKHKILFIIFLVILLGINTCILANTVTVGSGTATSGNVPIVSNWGYTYSQQIYTPAQIGVAGEIQRVSFYKAAGTITNSSDWVIYLGHTSKTSFGTTTDWVPVTNLTQVFSGNLTFPATEGWVEIALNTPFQYNNTENLVVAVDENTSGYGSLVNWRVFTSTSNSAIHYRNDSINPNPSSPPTANNRYATINQLQIGFPVTTPPNAAITPFPTDAATGVSGNPILTWVSGGGAPTDYDVYFATAAEGLPAIANANVLTPTWAPTGPLLYNTAYVWKVVPHNANGYCTTDIVTWGFTTMTDPTIIPDWAESFDGITFPSNVAWKNVKTAGSGTPGIWTRETAGTYPTCTPQSGAGMIRYNSFSLTGGTKGELSTPPITFPSDDYRVSFWICRSTGSPTNADLVNIYYSDTGQTSVGATLLGTVNRSTTLAPVVATEGWYKYTYNMPAGAAGSGRYVILEAVSAYGHNIFVDDISIEQIPNDPLFSYSPVTLTFPTTQSGSASTAQNVRVTNIGGGSLQLRAEDIRLSGEDIDDFRFSDANLADPLSAGQGLDIPVTFEPQRAGAKTATLVITYDSIDYEVALSGYAYAETALFEGFEGAFPPAGWANPGTWSASTPAFAGTKSAYKYGSSTTPYILSTPKLELEADSKLVFMARISNITSALDIVYSTDRTSWTKLGESILAPTANTWFQNVIDLSGIPDRAGRYYLGFRTMGSASYYVDNVIMPAAVQEAPEAVTLSSPTNAAGNQNLLPTLSWTPAANGGIPTSYDIYLEATTLPVAPEADPATLLINVPASPYTLITPLEYSTTYIWKVVAKNANGDAPASTVRSFTTKEDPTRPLPYLEDFNASTSLPANWTGTFSVGTIGGATGNGLYKNLWSSSASANAVTPLVGPITANTRLDFDYRYTEYTGHPATAYALAAGDKLEVQVSTNDGVSFETIYTIDNTNHTTTNLFNTASIFLTQAKALNAGDIVKLKFLATRAAGDYYLSIDNVSIKHISDTPVFAINPTVKAFGTVSVGASDTQTFTISNQGGGTMNIQSVALTGDLAQFSLIDLNTYPKVLGEPITVSVAFKPIAEGDFSVTLTIVDDIAKSKGNHTVTITGSGSDANNYGGGNTESSSGGYYFANSLTVGAPSSPSFAWINVSENELTNTDLDYGTVDDGFWGPIPIGFDFLFYGNTYNEFYLTTNGAISFSPLTNNSYWSNAGIPNTAVPNNLIALFWDDLKYFSGDSQILYENTGSTFIITMQNMGRTGSAYSPASSITAQAILYADGRIKLQYQSVTGNAHTPTIGIENISGTKGIQYHYNGAGGPYSTDAKGGIAVMFGENPATLPVTLSSFTAVLTADLHVKIAWISETETNHAGYNVLRSEVSNLSTAMRINEGMIEQGTASGTQMSYLFTDTEVRFKADYYYWLESVSLNGETEYYGPLMVTITTEGEEIAIPEIPVETKLFSAFPNPFNPSTNLRYSMKEAGDVRIDVYNLKGQLLKSFNNSHNQAGYYQVSWDGHDANGRLVGTGVYFYRMSSGNYSSTKKMIMAK